MQSNLPPIPEEDQLREGAGDASLSSRASARAAINEDDDDGQQPSQAPHSTSQDDVDAAPFFVPISSYHSEGTHHSLFTHSSLF